MERLTRRALNRALPWTGHGKGDEVLAAVGAVASVAVRASDFVGRLGGRDRVRAVDDTPASTPLEAAAVPSAT